jgi:serine/threonine protein kinase
MGSGGHENFVTRGARQENKLMTNSENHPGFSTGGIDNAKQVDLSPPTVDNYELVRLVGMGGMGAVFEAWQQAPSRRVALKVMHPDLLNSDFLVRFRQEADILARLEHPLIARIYDVTCTTGPGQQRPVFAMEYIDGATLDEYVQKNNLTLLERLRLIREIIRAVEVAHQRGVFHGDLKPANIMVDTDGNPRILDFGLSRLRREAGDQTIAKVPAMPTGRFGTPPYMSPELLGGPAHAIDVRCDVYALGVIATEILTGRRLNEEQDKPGPRAKRMDSDIEWILRMATAKNPDQRYPSAAAFAEDIDRLLTHHPVNARPRSAAYVLRKFAIRHKVMAAAFMIATASVLGGSVIALRSLAATREAHARTLEQKQKAELNLRQTLATVDQFMTLLSRSQLALVPEAGELRRNLLLDAVAFLDQLAERSPEILSIADQKSWAMAHLATDYALSGEIAKADTMHRDAIAFLTILRDRDIESPDLIITRNIARHWDELGGLLASTFKKREALDTYRKALLEKETLVRQLPGKIEYIRDLARTWDDIGTIQVEWQEFDDAVASFTASVELKRQVLLLEPRKPDHQRRLALSYSALGRAHLRAGASREGLEALEQAQAIMSSLESPMIPDYAFDMARLHGEMGQALTGLERNDEAINQFNKGDRIFRHILDRDPDDSEAMMGLAYLLGFWSEALTDSARIAKLQEAEIVWLQLLKSRPQNSAIRRALRWVQTRLDKPFDPGASLQQAQADMRTVPGDDADVKTESSDSTPKLHASEIRHLHAAAGSMVHVHGRVQSVNTRAGNTALSFIRFGTSRGQFSGVIPINALPAFESVYGEDLYRLVGADVVLHGLLSVHNQTPQIILTRTEQIIPENP